MKWPYLASIGILVLSCHNEKRQAAKADSSTVKTGVAAAKPKADTTTAPTVDTAGIIHQIRAEFQLINAQATSYKTVHKDISETTEGGDEDLYYDSAGRLRKIRVCNYGEMAQGLEEYYIKNDSLFFVYMKSERYKKEMDAHPKTDTWVEKRYYLYQNRVVKYLTNEKGADPIDFDETSKDLVGAYHEYLHPQTEN